MWVVDTFCLLLFVWTYHFFWITSSPPYQHEHLYNISKLKYSIYYYYALVESHQHSILIYFDLLWSIFDLFQSIRSISVYLFHFNPFCLVQFGPVQSIWSTSMSFGPLQSIWWWKSEFYFFFLNEWNELKKKNRI